MPFLAISARFPLGTFLGHESSGQPSHLPDPARLHAALTHAAGKGSLAEQRGDDLRISAPSMYALIWFEEHPPTALGIPAMARVSADAVAAAQTYRDDGVVEKTKGVVRIKKRLKRQSDAVAVSAPLWWAWDEEIPAEIMSVLAQLCEDVSCLGEADSPVVLEAHDAQTAAFTVTHRVATTQRPYPQPGGLTLRAPAAGRLQALEADYAAHHPVKRPTLSADRSSESQTAASFPPTRASLQELHYRPLEGAVADAPWNGGLLLLLDRPIDRHEVVSFCAGLHRTLTRLLGIESLPLLTGSYGPGVPRPANRVAIHYLCPGDAPIDVGPGGAFLVLLPESAEPSEVATVARVAHAVKRVYLGAQGARTVTESRPVGVVDFWPEVPAGLVRFWRPVLALVPEMNRPRKRHGWSLDDTTLLSLGHVLRERLVVEGQPGEDPRRARVNAVRATGAWAGGSRRLPDSRTERYVHKAPPSLVIQPYTAFVHTGDLLPDRAAWALGQSRHLGGGFMVPFDLAPDTAKQVLGWTPC